MNDVRIEYDEKNGLSIGEESTQRGLSISALIYAFVFLLAGLFICVPKIYLSSTIYYLSRDINKLQTQSDLLKEENKRRSNEREILRYNYLKQNLKALESQVAP